MWELSFLPEAREDLRALDGSQRIRVVKAIAKVQSNPLPSSEGGYGKPLGEQALVPVERPDESEIEVGWHPDRVQA